MGLRIWSQEETDFLVKNYTNLKTDELLKVLKNKTNDQLRWKAKEFGLIKKVSKSKSDIRFLEDFDNKESLYWWGFITADGCFNCENKTLIIAAEEKDGFHIEKFCKLSNSHISKSTRINDWHKTPYTMVRTAITDKFTVSRLIEKLKIKPQKTYNPFDLTVFLTKDRLAFFMAGLIDGDGYIAYAENSVCIKIKCHPNWEENFKYISNSLKEFYDINSSIGFVKDGDKKWLVLTISPTTSVLKLYNLIKLDCPILERKWKNLDKIVLNKRHHQSLSAVL